MISLAISLSIYLIGMKLLPNIMNYIEKITESNEYQVKYYPNGNKYYEAWYQNNKLHQLNGPALIGYNENSNTISFIRWAKEGKLHRDNSIEGMSLPAYIDYYENGNIKHEIFFKNGKIYNMDDYVENVYYENGNIKYKNWTIFYFHRLNGPVTIEYDINGKIKNKYYWLNSNYFNKIQYYKIISLVKRFINKIKYKEQIKLNLHLNQTRLSYIGKDVNNLICRFVY